MSLHIFVSNKARRLVKILKKGDVKKPFIHSALVWVAYKATGKTVSPVRLKTSHHCLPPPNATPDRGEETQHKAVITHGE